MKNQTGVATAGFWLGIAGLLIAFFLNIAIGMVICIAGIICSAIGMESGLARAKWGLGLSIAGVVLSVIALIFM